MAKPKLATSRPAALTGTLGQGGVNRPHDVALVQALLGAKRDKRGRPYLRERVTGKYDRDTAEALLSYRMDQRDGNIKRPLNARGPMLNKLAQGQSLAVLEGTAMPYKIALPAEPGPIKGPAAKYLSAERKVALQEVMKAVARDWHIAFDVEIKAATGSARSIASAPFESRPLVAHFQARNLSIHTGRGLSAVPSNAQFRARAKAFYEAVSADLMARCTQAFGIKDPVDVKIQQSLKDDLACVVRTDVEGVEALAQFLLAVGRKRGLQLAVRFFQHYLGASGRFIELSREETLEFEEIRDAVQINIERFKQRNFIAPESSTPGSSTIEDITKNSGTRVTQFQDHWKKDISFSSVDLILFELFGDMKSASLALSAGSSSVTSTGDFLLRRQGDQILVTGAITHIWTDPGYNFDRDKSFDKEARILEKHGKAKPFQWKAEWTAEVEGLLQIENIFQPDAKLRWINFETHPGS